ncbi:hypothetical protein L798_02471 [Zootermopsis nevadensis]|uniref:Uncharacterized protein n=2 Tax=Zootermopsis nevadensis TaxID=136037 RepID=A0A067RP33_ZOONE|nr:hypothetical protein L798_02471 [Zootermopsis nevadensis]
MCTGLQQEKENSHVPSESVVESDLPGIKSDSVCNVSLACKGNCVSGFSVDGKGCNRKECGKGPDSKVGLDIKDDGSAVLHDSEVDCENVVSKVDSKNSVKQSIMECENSVSHDLETDVSGSGRVVIDINDSISKTNPDIDHHIKTAINEDCVMGMTIKNCKEAVSDIIEHNETVNNSSSGIDCKEVSHSVHDGYEYSNAPDKPQRQVLSEVPEISDHKVKTGLEQVIHAECESDASEGGRSIRRSTRSSVGKVRAAMLHCITAGRTKSTKLGLQEKSQDVVKDEAESLSVCLTEEGSNMGSEDVTFSSQMISEDSGEMKEVERRKNAVVAEANSVHKTEDLSLNTSTTVLKTHSVPSKENDIYVRKEKELSEEKENTLCVDLLIIRNENETSDTNLDIKLLKEFIVQPEKTSEKQIILDQDKKQKILGPKMVTSDVNDFAEGGSENTVRNEDSFDLKPVVKNANENITNIEDTFVVESVVKEKSILSIESNSKFENETDNKLPEVTQMKKDRVDCISELKDVENDGISDVNQRQVHKLHNTIEPSLFYSKEIKSCDSKDKSLDDIVKGSESDISESLCDSKDQHASSSTKEEFPSCVPKCSSEVRQASDSSKSFSEEVFQMNVEQCDKVSGEHSEHVIPDTNSVLHSVSKFEVGESLHDVSNSADGSVVESSRHLDAGGKNSKVTDSENTFVEEDVSPEEQAIKESVLSALGLQPLRAMQGGVASGSRKRPCEGNYTGTLKTVIKLQRSSPEKRRTPLKLVLKHGKAHSSVDEPSMEKGEEEFEDLDFDGQGKIEYSICKETGTSDNTKDPYAFGIGSRKCLKPAYSYRYFDISSNPHFIADKSNPGDRLSPEISSKDDGKAQSTKQSGNLVIPEKSSSFSIHPGRLCSDVCSYCFGKFGSLDTPCHIAQLKSSERQQKILQAETHLTADSCLCDACYRHVDRKANCPSYKPNKKRQHHRSVSSRIKTPCCVRGCSQIAEHHVRRKWLIKLKRSIAKKVRIDMDKMPQHLPFPLCLTHYTWIDYFMVCGICKRRLTRNHMYPLGPEVHELNTALESDGIPAHLSDKLFVCKLCRYFSSVRLKYKDPSQLAGNQKLFYQGYRKRLLQFHNIEEEVDEETAEEAPPKQKRRKTKATTSAAVKVDGEDDSGTKSKCELISQSENQHLGDAFGPATIDFSSLGDVSIDRSGASTPMIDYSSLGNGASNSNLILFDDIGSSQKQTLKLGRVKSTKLKLKLGSGKISNLNYNQSEEPSSRSILLPVRDGLEVTPVHDSLSKPFYPGVEELPLHANFEFHGKKEQETSNNRRGEWEKCTATIQFDKDTKILFQQLQRPYGNHSSFFRHLILLEKYWRSGELILAPSASSRATNYVNSVQNRIQAYEGHPSSAHLGSPFISSPHLSSTTSATSVPVIDLPLKRRLGGGILTASDGSTRPVTITRMSGVSIAPRPVTFTSVSSAGVSSSQSRMPVFTAFPQNSPSPVPRKVIMDTVATSVASHFQQSRRIPNVLQVTAGGKSFSIVPGLTQIRHIQSFQQQQHQFQREQQQESSCFGPLICDVRSLATENGSALWDQNVTQQSGKSNQKPNISVSLLPKTSTGTTFKPSTIVTPTGIILSRKPEISVTAVTEKKDVTLKPKAISSKRDSVSKVKPSSEKLDLMKTKAVLEEKEIVLQEAVSELKDSLPLTKC